MVEVDSKEEALGTLPPAYRPQATIVQLNRFTIKDMEQFAAHDAA